MVQVWHHILLKCGTCVKKGASKTASKKVTRQTQTTTSSNARRLPEQQPRVRISRQETVVRATVEALFEILAAKSGLGSKLMQKTDWIADMLQKTELIVENW